MPESPPPHLLIQDGAPVSALFVRFLVAGGFAAIVNFGSRFFFDLIVSFPVAIILAFGCGLVVAFVLNKKYVFTSSAQPTAVSAAWFAAINLFALAQTWFVTMGLARALSPAIGSESVADAVSHAAGIMVPVFTSYIGHRHLTFRAAG